jgi:malate dehydrogenase (oxaloacetate-decarboxylating)(NADP+)
MIRRDEALRYHSTGRPGKIEVTSTKPLLTQRDLSLAYTPGVAEPCLAIEKEPNLAYEYTARGNLVAVVSNGTATLGLGDIGPLACKPVMEGKGCLFKRFADIDVFDIELNCHDIDQFVEIVAALEPTFGGINLEDIKAPECFAIEEKLRKRVSIPVFHDDQHGTAIITGAALINALDVAKKEPGVVRVVVSGAGAAAIACANFFQCLGILREHITLVDSKGVVYEGREEGMNPYKQVYAQKTSRRTLAEALEDADVFLGCSKGGLLKPEMLQVMAGTPIVFALANPVPEIGYPEAKEARPDVIMATGRSDYPNQVNNVLGFPFIFRGALDTRAVTINEPMKVAAAEALAKLAREPVPPSVLQAYNEHTLRFGRDYLIPKPFDPRVLTWVAPAVARAAMQSGVARWDIDFDTYTDELAAKLEPTHEILRQYFVVAKRLKRRVAFPAGNNENVLRACQTICDEGLANPVLLGDADEIHQQIEELGLDICDVEIVNPAKDKRFDDYVNRLVALRCRKGITVHEARRRMVQRLDYSLMMLKSREVDGVLCGNTRHYDDALRPALQIIGLREGFTRASSMHMIIHRSRAVFFADTTVNLEVDAETLAQVAIESANKVRALGVEPRVAMLSFSNFGSTRHPLTEKVSEAVKMVRTRRPDIPIDSEMQASFALDPELRQEHFPFCGLKGDANVLIFPSLEASNIAFKLVQYLSDAAVVGPILLGMRQPVTVMMRGASAEDIYRMTAITMVEQDV